ncbi:hypothetical protein, partial [Dokdonia pacifica]
SLYNIPRKAGANVQLLFYSKQTKNEKNLIFFLSLFKILKQYTQELFSLLSQHNNRLFLKAGANVQLLIYFKQIKIYFFSCSKSIKQQL